MAPDPSLFLGAIADAERVPSVQRIFERCGLPPAAFFFAQKAGVGPYADHTGPMERMIETALEWHRAGRIVAIITVMETWGSAPRRAGSQMVVAQDGGFAGSVSGGCIEAAVINEAQEAIASGQARVLDYGVSDVDAFAAGLACGGHIRLLVEPVGAVLPEAMLIALAAARQRRKSLAYVVNLATGARGIRSDGEALHKRFCTDQSGVDGDEFVALHLPPSRLILVGAVQIAQAILPMAHILGHELILIDPRAAFATAARFPNTRICTDWPDRVLPDLALDARTALVTLSHEARIDDPALILALPSKAAYVGALGSRRTQEARAARLGAAGLAPEDIARLKAPVGLAIGAATPSEIGLSILAEIVATFRGSVN